MKNIIEGYYTSKGLTFATISHFDGMETGDVIAHVIEGEITRVFASSRLFAFFGLPSASFFRCRSASTHISISGEAQISPGEAPSQEVSASSASDSAPNWTDL